MEEPRRWTRREGRKSRREAAARGGNPTRGGGATPTRGGSPTRETPIHAPAAAAAHALLLARPRHLLSPSLRPWSFPARVLLLAAPLRSRSISLRARGLDGDRVSLCVGGRLGYGSCACVGHSWSWAILDHWAGSCSTYRPRTMRCSARLHRFARLFGFPKIRNQICTRSPNFLESKTKTEPKKGQPNASFDVAWVLTATWGIFKNLPSLRTAPLPLPFLEWQL